MIIPLKKGGCMSYKILAVDDEAHILKLIEGNLKKHGFDVVTASDGAMAIQQAADHLPDLIILDIMMLGMDGPAVAESLKKNYKTKDIPVVFLTALVQKNEEVPPEETLRNGGDVFIAKPVNGPKLVATIQRVLDFYGHH